MKFLNKNKRIIVSILVFVLIAFILVLTLYYTGNLHDFFFKAENEYKKITVIGIVIFLLAFIYELFRGALSNYILDKIFPGIEKELLEDNKRIRKDLRKIRKNDKIRTETTSEILRNSKEILNQIDFDPRRLNKLIKELIHIEENALKIIEIEKWYEHEKVSYKEKETLLIVLEYNRNTVSRLENKVKEQSEIGNYEFASSIEKIKNCLKDSDAESLKTNYFSVIKTQTENRITLLKETINASLQLLAFSESKELFKELIKLEPIAENYNEFGSLLLKFGYYDDAIIEFEKSLEIIEKDKTDAIDISIVLSNLGSAHTFVNNYNEAIKYLSEAIESSNSNLEQDTDEHNKVQYIYYNNLALAQKKNNQFDDAIKNYEIALELNDKSIYEDRSENLANQMWILTNIGTLYSSKGDLNQAEKKFNDALDIYMNFSEEIRKIYLTELSLVKHSLAIFFGKKKKDITKAIPIYKEVIEIYINQSEKDKSRVGYIASIYIEMANLYIDHNQLKKSVENFKLAIKYYDLNGESDLNSIDKARVYNDIGNTYMNIQDYKLADTNFSQSLKIYDGINLGNNISYLKGYAVVLNNFGVLYKKREKYDLALGMYNKALIIRENLALEKNPSFLNDYAATLNNIGAIEFNLDNHKEALTKFEKVLKIRKQIAQDEPYNYELIYAQSLISYFTISKNYGYLFEAEGILNKYEFDEVANQLKNLIKQFK